MEDKDKNKIKDILLAVLTAGFVVWCLVGSWSGHGRTRLVARTSNFIQIKMALDYYAQQNGHYPETLDEIAGNPSLQEIGIDNLVYTASLKPYDAEASIQLLYEKEPRRYGFTVGFFDIYSNRATEFRKLK